MLQDFIRAVTDNKFKCNFIFVNMPHRTHKCTNTLYDYAIINYNTYVSLMYELKKKIGEVLTSKSVGNGPSSYEKKNLPGRSLTKVEKHRARAHAVLIIKVFFYFPPQFVQTKYASFLPGSFQFTVRNKLLYHSTLHNVSILCNVTSNNIPISHPPSPNLAVSNNLQ